MAVTPGSGRDHRARRSGQRRVSALSASSGSSTRSAGRRSRTGVPGLAARARRPRPAAPRRARVLGDRERARARPDRHVERRRSGCGPVGHEHDVGAPCPRPSGVAQLQVRPLVGLPAGARARAGARDRAAAASTSGSGPRRGSRGPTARSRAAEDVARGPGGAVPRRRSSGAATRRQPAPGLRAWSVKRSSIARPRRGLRPCAPRTRRRPLLGRRTRVSARPRAGGRGRASRGREQRATSGAISTQHGSIGSPNAAGPRPEFRSVIW